MQSAVHATTKGLCLQGFHALRRTVQVYWWKEHPEKAGSSIHAADTLTAGTPCGTDQLTAGVQDAVFLSLNSGRRECIVPVAGRRQTDPAVVHR